MEPKFVDLPETYVVGLRVTVQADNKAVIPETWKSLRPLEQKIPGRIDGRAYGVILPSQNGPMPRVFDYLAGLEVTALTDSLYAPLEQIHLCPQRYAVFTHVIEDCNLGKDLPRTFRYIFDEWLPHSPYKMAKASDFEFYDGDRFDPKTLSGEIDLYIPIEEKA